MTPEELEIIKKSVKDTFLLVNPSSFSCVILSCAFEFIASANNGPKVSVTAGDVLLDSYFLFKSNDDFSALDISGAEENETRIFDGHVWAEVDNYIVDLSLLRTVFDQKFPVKLRNTISAKMNRNKPGAIISTYENMDMFYGLQFRRKIYLTNDQVNYFGASVHAHNKTQSLKYRSTEK